MLSRLVKPVSRVGSVIARTASTQAASKQKLGQASQEVFDRESLYGAHNYHPLPVALSRAQGQ